MGEAAETGDYRMMPLGIVVEVIEGLARTAADLIAQVAEAGYRPLLAGQVLGVLQDQVGEHPAHRRQLAVEAFLQALAHHPLRPGVAGVGARRVAVFLGSKQEVERITGYHAE